MKKFVFTILVFLFSSNLFSAYLMQYQGYNYCINSFSIPNNANNVDVILSSNNQTYNLDLDPTKDIFQGYDYNSSSDTCNQKKILLDTGLNYNDYNFLIALCA